MIQVEVSINDEERSGIESGHWKKQKICYLCTPSDWFVEMGLGILISIGADKSHDACVSYDSGHNSNHVNNWLCNVNSTVLKSKQSN